MDFKSLFPRKKPLIACIHLAPLPGAPLFDGDVQAIFDQAIKEAEMFEKLGMHGLVIENFRDLPFYPGSVPSETVATMAAIAREITNRIKIPVGINVLRNDADAALAVATASNADFIRVNVHNGAALCDQGIIQGLAHETLRKRAMLRSKVLIFADVAVKHAQTLAPMNLATMTRDLAERSLVDAVIVSGTGTGVETQLQDLKTVKENTELPVLIGSGTTPSNLRHLHSMANGFIVGSYFKRDGVADNEVEGARVKDFVQVYNVLS